MGQNCNYAWLKSHIKGEMLHFCYSVLHAQLCALRMCPFRKQMIQCCHQLRNRAYRQRVVYIVEAYSEWRRGEEVITTKVKKKKEINAEWQKSYTHTLYTHIQSHTGAHPQIESALKGRGRSVSLAPVKPGTGLLFAAINRSSFTDHAKTDLWHD